MQLQKTKQEENCQICNFFLLNGQILVSDSSTIILKKGKKCPRNKNTLYDFLYKIINIFSYYYVITKNQKTITFLKLTFYLWQVPNRI